jgi:hypothetical protein
LCVAILVGGLHGTYENGAFSQVSLRQPVRFLHCTQRAPARNAKLKILLKFYSMKKNEFMKKVANLLVVPLMQIIGHQNGA